MNKEIKHLPEVDKEMNDFKALHKKADDFRESLDNTNQKFTLDLFLMYLRGMKMGMKTLPISEIEQLKDKFINEILRG